jgi:anti-sigma-K factor RskA
MTAGDHTTFKDEVGAYLLGALSDAERASFEGHLVDCPECRHELERLRPAADLLPRSVEQVEPPPSLKRSLMEVVEREAKERDGAPSVPRTPVGERLRGWLGGSLRPALVGAAVVLAVAIGFGVAQLGGDDTRTVAARVDPAMPQAGGSLRIEGDDATLRLHDMPELGGARVYQVWLQHGDRLVPARTFTVGRSGAGRVELPDVSDAKGVFVTREPRGGAQVPSENPIVSVPL